MADLHVDTLEAADYASFLADLLGQIGDGEGGVARVDLSREKAERDRVIAADCG